MQFSIIVAADSKNGIGKNGKIPWQISADMKYFGEITRGAGKNVVIMGRTTWESLPAKHRPLKERINIVLTRNSDLNLPPHVAASASLDEALEKAAEYKPEKIFVIGGANVYAQAISHPSCAEIFLTRIRGQFECDTFFPEIDETKFVKKRESEVFTDNELQLNFLVYSKK